MCCKLSQLGGCVRCFAVRGPGPLSGQPCSELALQRQALVVRHAHAELMHLRGADGFARQEGRRDERRLADEITRRAEHDLELLRDGSEDRVLGKSEERRR